MDLSICVVTMNHRAFVGDCLHSIYANPPSRRPFEVIVVDNCSTDGTRDVLREWTSSRTNLTVVWRDSVESFAANNNTAFSIAQGKHILALNPDTLVCSGTLDYMLDYLEVNPELGAATCKLIYGDGTFQGAARRFPRIKYLLANRLAFWGVPGLDRITREYIMCSPDDVVPKEVDYILGACMFMHRETVLGLGGFDERFRLYTEDADLCFRMRKAGRKVMYVPGAEIVHFHQRTGARFPLGRAGRLQLHSTLLFFAKHYWGLVR